MTALSAPHFTDPDKARQYLESIRWPDGPVCPHCGVIGDHYALNGKAHRPGLWKCKDCRKQFSVTVGTVFERSKIPLNKWLMATYLMCSSKKGISAHQIHRTLGVTYKTAWFMNHRIRHAMGEPYYGPLGSGGGTVEADETYFGRKKGAKTVQGGHHKHAIFSLVERGGRVRSKHVAGKMFDEVKDGLSRVSPDAHLMTDESRLYTAAGKGFASHGTVNHSAGEYGKGYIHTNTIENYFSVFKRGMKGVYQHCTEDHMQRYLAEFDFRYNYRVKLGYSDLERSEIALKGIAGKRLTYHQPDEAHA